MPPLARRVAQAEDELLRFARPLCLGQLVAVLVINEAHEPVFEELGLGVTDKPRNGAARVPAAAVAEYENEIGRGRDEASEVRRLAASCRDERPREQEREQNPTAAEPELQPDRVGDVRV